MSNRVLEFIIRAKDQTAAGIQAAGTTFQKFRRRVGSGARRLTKQLFGLRSGLISVAGAAGGFAYALKTAFEFERYETQFKVLLGSLDKAKRHMAELQEFSSSTPFQFADIAQASRSLHVFTNGALGASQSMTLVGDAAAAVGAPLGEVAMWAGRAYAAIKGGRPFGEAAQRLQELGLLAPDVRAEIEDMTEAGAENIEIWLKLQESLEKFEGGMDELSKTGEGLISTLRDEWKLAVEEFGKAFVNSSKNDISSMTDALRALRQNGDIAVWAERVKRSFDIVREAAGPVKTAFRWFWEKAGISDVAAVVFSGPAAVAGAISAGDYEGVGDAYRKALGRSGHYYGRALESTESGQSILQEIEDERQAIEDHEQNLRESARERHKKESEEEAQNKKSMHELIAADMAEAQKKIDEKRAIAADMAEAQKKIDEKRAKEKAEKEKDEREKAEREMERERERQMRKMVAEEGRLRRAMIREQTQAARKDLQGLQEKHSDASSRLSVAQRNAAQAWGWYRDPDSFKAHLNEEKADAEARQQYERDLAKLKRDRSWESRTLDPHMESVRRVYLAEIEKKQAEKALVEIAENTKASREALEKALAMQA